MKRILAMGLLMLGIYTKVALAECAWVLWRTVWSEDDPTLKRSVILATDTKAGCDQHIPGMIANLKREYKHATVNGYALTIRDKGTLWYQTFNCLPDTIDPRKLR
jgi:hypothetical protein